jgi:hypothetical protein
MTMVEGETLWLTQTGHSIQSERPAFFAGRVLTFLFAGKPAPPLPPALLHVLLAGDPAFRP